MRRIAVLSACVLAGGLLCPSSALATEDHEPGGEDHRWIAVEDHFAIVLPDGQTFTEDAPPPSEDAPPPEGEEPGAIPVGARLFISEALYSTEDGEEVGHEIGRTHIECTGQVVPDHLLCDIVFAFDEGGQLHGSVLVDFSAASETEAFGFDIAVTGGTGNWSQASGVVSLLDITDVDDPVAETTTLYEVHTD